MKDVAAVYCQGVKVPKHAGLVTVFTSGITDARRCSLVQRVFGRDRELHRTLAVRSARRARRLQNLYDRALDVAAQKVWGCPFRFGDYRISGIGSDEFHESDKSRLRRLVRNMQAYRDIARAHAAAAGAGGLRLLKDT